MKHAPRVLFLDDDHALRIFRRVLAGREHEPATGAWLLPERPDFASLVEACRGLRSEDGAIVGQEGSAEEPVHDAHIIVFRRGTVDRARLAQHPSLRLVVRLGERPEGVDMDALRERGVRLACVPRPSLHFTAEHVIALMLALAKQLLAADQAMRQGPPPDPQATVNGVAYNWLDLRGATGLHGRTLGIVGLGEVGTLVARLARAFGMRVLYTKRRRADTSIERELGVDYASLRELLAASDHVSLNLSNEAGTQGFADADFFAAMQPGAFFINTSRGSLVDEDALYEALVQGRIAGAGLDVHAVEPRMPGDRFTSLPNVVLSPHVAAGARSGILREFEAMARHMALAMA